MDLLKVAGLRMEFGGVVALAGLDLVVSCDEILGVVGPNGSGKTTFFNVVAGAYRPTAGRVEWRGKDITGKPPFEIARLGIARSFQQAMAFQDLPVAENVLIAWERGSRARETHTRWNSPGEILDFVGLGDVRTAIAGSLPFGNLRRLGVAVALATHPRLVLMDEPAAGLNDTETAELTDLVTQLPQMGIGVCVIDHDMNLIASLCGRLIVLDYGTKIAEGPPADVLRDPKVLEVYLGAEP